MDPFVVDKHRLCGEDAVIRGLYSGIEFVLTPEPGGNSSDLDWPAITGEGLERGHTYEDPRRKRRLDNKQKWSSWGGQPSALTPTHPSSKSSSTSKGVASLTKAHSTQKLTFSPTKRPSHGRRKSFLVKPKVLVPPPDFIQVNIDSIKMICKKPELEGYFIPQMKSINSENSLEDDFRRNRSLMRSYDMGEISEDTEFFKDVKTSATRRKSQLEIRYKELTSFLSPPPEPPKIEPVKIVTPPPPPPPLRNNTRSRTVSGIDLLSQKVVGQKGGFVRGGSKRTSRKEESSRSVLSRIHKMRAILGKDNDNKEKRVGNWLASPRYITGKSETKPRAGGTAPGKYHHKHTVSLPGPQGGIGTQNSKGLASSSMRVTAKSQTTLKRPKDTKKASGTEVLKFLH